jgi:hypothetical protein
VEKQKRDIIGEWQQVWTEQEKRWRLKKRAERLAARAIRTPDFPSLPDRERETEKSGDV